MLSCRFAAGHVFLVLHLQLGPVHVADPEGSRQAGSKVACTSTFASDCTLE